MPLNLFLNRESPNKLSGIKIILYLSVSVTLGCGVLVFFSNYSFFNKTLGFGNLAEVTEHVGMMIGDMHS